MGIEFSIEECLMDSKYNLETLIEVGEKWNIKQKK